VTVYASDAYNRTVTDGLGSATVGGAYTLSGPATGFSVSNGAGRLRLAAPGSSLAARLGSVSVRDVDVKVESMLDRSPSGGGTYVGLAARRVTDAEYRVKLRREATGRVTLSLVKVVSRVETVLATQVIAGLQPTTTDTLMIRFSLTGTGPSTLRAKVWRLASAEPSSWQVTATDTTAALAGPGAVGVWAYVSASATTTPVTAWFDNLLALGG
jgi:hypothetical protein